MSSLIILRCSACKARIKAPIQLLGQTRACPGCGHRFVVQFAAPEEAGPLLVMDEEKAPAMPRPRRGVAV